MYSNAPNKAVRQVIKALGARAKNKIMGPEMSNVRPLPSLPPDADQRARAQSLVTARAESGSESSMQAVHKRLESSACLLAGSAQSTGITRG